jgi:hypothetical protein
VTRRPLFAVLALLSVAEPLNAIRFQGDLIIAEQGGSVVRASGTNPAERATLAAGPGCRQDWRPPRTTYGWVSGRPAGCCSLSPTGGCWRGHASWQGTWRHRKGWRSRREGSDCWWVESGAGRLLRIELATGRVTTVAEGLALGAQGIPGLAPTTWASTVWRSAIRARSMSAATRRTCCTASTEQGDRRADRPPAGRRSV